MNLLPTFRSILDSSLASVSSVPIGLHSFALAGLIGGLILWLLGGKLLRPAFALVGIAVGAALGGVLVPALGPETIFGYAALHVGMTIGALLGLILSMTLFRFAMAVAGAVVCAVLGLLIAGISLSRTPGALPVEVPTLTSTDGLHESLGQTIGKIGDDLTDAAKKLQDGTSLTDLAKDEKTAPGARQVASELQAKVQDLWERTPSESKLTLTGGAFIGALVGLVVGAIMPKKSAALFTAFLGSASLLASAVWLVNAGSLPGRELLDRGPVAWLFIWLAVGIVGVIIQTARAEKRKAAPAKQPS